MHADLVIHNIGQLLTCSSTGRAKRGSEMSDCGIIADAGVAIIDGKLAAFGRSSDVIRDFKSDSVIDAKQRVVLPGFVDPHTHLVFGGDRFDEFELKITGTDYLEILEKGGGIISTVKKTREESEKKLVLAGLKRLRKMLACGTTTVEIKTGYGLDLDTELKMLNVISALDQKHPIDIIPTFLPAHAVPPEFKSDSESYVEIVCGEMLPKAWDWFQASHFSAKRTPFFADVFCEKNAFSLAQSERVLRTAKALWFGIKAHADEFTNLGCSSLAIDLGATSIDHLDEISDDEINLLANSETVGVVTPTVNFNLGSSKFANARKLIDSNCAVALSTDYNPGSAPCPSPPLAMAIACRYQKLLPSEAINAATINGAFAVGQGDLTGSIDEGKLADLVIFDTQDYREIAYEFGGSLAAVVIKRGEIVYEKFGV